VVFCLGLNGWAAEVMWTTVRAARPLPALPGFVGRTCPFSRQRRDQDESVGMLHKKYCQPPQLSQRAFGMVKLQGTLLYCTQTGQFYCRNQNW